MTWIMKLYNILISSLVFFLLFACSEKPVKDSRVERLPYYQEATFTPHWLTDNDPKLDTFHRISPFQLINQEGDTISERDFDDKIYVVDFFFTSCPGMCPKMTENMTVLQDEFLEDEEVWLLSHSVTPERDSVSILKNYAESKGILSETWHLATGEQSTIYKLARRDYFVEEDLGLTRELDEFLHTENFVLIDKNRHIRGIYNGLNMSDVKQLAADIRTLKKEG